MVLSRPSRLIAVLLLIALWPGLALAQESRAGVVTTLQGQAVVARPVVAQPIPLKFRDDVFMRDRVETREDALVRILLGGKALVTVRELSTFTVTEEPNRAVLDLQNGKAAVGVARSLLRPGESIEVRTPNAVAGIRGSLLVVTVEQVGGVYRSTFSALQATVPITIAPLSNPSATVPLQPNQSVGVTGSGGSTQVGPVTNLSPAQVQAAAQTAEAPRPAELTFSSPMAAEIRTAKVSEAVALASLLAPPPPGEAPAETSASAQDPALTQASQSQSTIFQPSTVNSALGGGAFGTTSEALVATSVLQVNAEESQQVAGEIAPVPATPVPGPPDPVPPVVPPTPFPPLSLACGEDICISNQTVLLEPEQTLRTFSGATNRASGSPVARITNSQVSAPGHIFDVAAGAEITLASPLLEMTGPSFEILDPNQPLFSFLQAGGSVLNVDGRLTGTAAVPLLDIDPTIVVALNLVTVGPAGVLDLAGSLLRDAGGFYLLTENLVRVTGGGRLIGRSSDPLISLDTSLAFSGRQLFLLDGGARATLAGSLLSATGSSILAGDPSASVSGLLAVLDGGSVTGNSSAAPLLSFVDSTVTSAGPIVTIRRSPSSATPTEMSLSGPLFSAVDSSVATSSLGFGPTFGTPGACCSGFTVRQGARLSSSTSEPLVELRASFFSSGPDFQSGGHFFPIADSFDGAPAGELVAPSSVSLTGPLLRATDSQISALFSLLGVFRSSFTNSGNTEPLIQLDRSTVSLGGPNPFEGDAISYGAMLHLVASAPAEAVRFPGSVSIGGPFLRATNDSQLSMTGDLMLVSNGGQFTGGTSTTALVELQNTFLAVGGFADNLGDLLQVDLVGGPDGATPSRATLNGTLLSATGGSLNLTGGLLAVTNGGIAVVSAAGAATPLASITGGDHAIGTGPGSAIFRILGRDAAVAPAPAGGQVPVDADRPLQPGGVLLQTDGAIIGASTPSQRIAHIDRALLEASQPFLNAMNGSRITTATNALDLSIARVTAAGDLVQLRGSTLQVLNGHLVNANQTFLQVGGNLVSLFNGSTLTIGNGTLLNVAGNSVADIQGALVFFSGAGNRVNINNTLCAANQCLALPGGFRVALTNGAQAANVQVANPVVSAPGAANNIINAGASTAHAAVSGAGSRLIAGPR